MNENQYNKHLELKKNILKSKNIKEAGFTLVYQPKINLENKHVISWEVLSRWEHKKYGFISPIEFIKIIKELEMEYQFDIYVLEEVYEDISTINGDSNTYSINISTNTLKIKNIDKEIIDITKRYNINPKNITFEVVETSDIESYDLITDTINNLNNIGFSISIDDFGTGYSSYYRLCNMKFNEIKIPKEFLPTDTTDKERKIKVLKSIVDMAKSLECKVVIEGIETIENHKLAKMLEIDYAQGFLYSHPISFEEYLNLMANE
ncbi:EAL domain-containing protein [Romboutsia lituseburensis]|uniref:EAL domain-containing protein n=1 Tax=Romboutsia lituseburensis TaxID=1537 RepID=UPI00215AECF8|nr:EAL domain-containing protein [Romboutsia lituseburensis]MCR8746008.1 EAL domain-containing protein [Romboutsia lituseburensis]